MKKIEIIPGFIEADEISQAYIDEFGIGYFLKHYKTGFHFAKPLYKRSSLKDWSDISQEYDQEINF